MKHINKVVIFLFALLFSLPFSLPSTLKAATMNDFTAYPAFTTTTIPPNILLVLDQSGSMQFPAYLQCAFDGYNNKVAKCGNKTTQNDPSHRYDPSSDYYGYFDKEKYYDYGSNKFSENSACSYTDRIGGPKCISGNLLNWAAMTRTDVIRKVLFGGKSVSTQENAHTLRGEGGSWSYSDSFLGCTFTVSGGNYPNLDHTLSITSYETIKCDTTQSDDFNDGAFNTSKWEATDIGSPGVPGSEVEEDGSLKVQSSGTRIWSTSDNFRFIYQQFTGDFDVTLHVSSPPDLNEYSKAGLMVRETTAAGSKHVMAMVTRDHGIQFASRNSDNGSTSSIGTVDITSPVWVRLKREGDTFTALYSTDGTDWELYEITAVTMSSSVYVGMATASYKADTPGTGTYNQFNYCEKTSCVFDQPSDPDDLPVNANIKVDVPDNTRQGVIQKVADKEEPKGNFDPDAPRFGLMIYNSDNKVGCMLVGIEGADMSSFLNALQSEPAYSGTPTGEAIEEAWDYFLQIDNHKNCNNNAYVGDQGSNKDPWYDQNPNPPPNRIPAPCRKSFVLVVSDGEWNGAIDPVIPARETHTTDIRTDISDSQTLSYYSVYAFNDNQEGRNAMKHISMFGNFNDVDNDKYPYPYPDSSNRVFPTGKNSKDIAVPPSQCNPGTPDSKCREWDSEPSPPDGIPDSYYEATDGEQLEAELLSAIEDIMRKATSGTAVSVAATTGEGEGAIYQAYFFPAKTISGGDYKWLGYLQGLFVDKYGNMRANTNNPATKQLDYGLNPDGSCTDSAQDYIVRIAFDQNKQETMVHYYYDKNCDGEWDCGKGKALCTDDINGDGKVDEYDEYYTDSGKIPVPIDQFTDYLWEAGSILHQTDPAQRAIYTTINGSGGTDQSKRIEFKEVNAGLLQKFMQQPDITSTNNLINYIRGVDFPQYRTRTFDGNVWKLGDIVHSSPVTISKPVENYDTLYGDSTYKEFVKKYENRRQVIYVGANDGMLHAFNGGFYNPQDLRFYRDYSNGTFSDTAGKPLGSELWAFVPKSALPHLQWYARTDYTHVYYVDGKPRVADVRIFNEDADHPKGWGTILIGSMRFGGKKGTGVKVCSDDITKVCTNLSGNEDTSVCLNRCTVELNSSYFALDITNPEKTPNLLWTFDDPVNLGLTLSIPTILRKYKVDANNQVTRNDWYAVFGSGPGVPSDPNRSPDPDSLDKAPYEGISKQEGKVYILKLNGSNGIVDTWTEGTNYWVTNVGDNPANLNELDPNAFMGNPITVDIDLDYDVDVMYIGNTYCPSGKTCPPLDATTTNSPWAGKMYRMKTDPPANPADWELTTLYNAGQPITAAPAASIDERGNLWVYFGTGRFLSQEDKFFKSDTSVTQKDGDRYHFYGIKDVCRPWVENSCSGTKLICPGNINGTSIAVDPIEKTYLIDVTHEEVSSTKQCSDDGSTCEKDSDCSTITCNAVGNIKQCSDDKSPCEKDSDCSGVTCNLVHSHFQDHLNAARNCDTAGWMYQFPKAGERSFSKPVLFGGMVIWPTYSPSKDLCKSEGESFLYAVNFETGTATDYEVFKEDANSDKDHIDRRKKLGQGLPSDVSLAKRGSNKVVPVLQLSTGSMPPPVLELEDPLSSKFIGWKEEQIPFDILENDD